MQPLHATRESTGSRVDFAAVESAVNEILDREWRNLVSDPEAQARYARHFDRTVEEGFYEDPRRRGDSLPPPGARPNEAYILAHEAMWEPVDRYLETVGWTLDRSFRELFASSREYEDTATEHRRVFFGQFLDPDGRPVTAFMLTVPHSHAGFRFSTPMLIGLSRPIPPEAR